MTARTVKKRSEAGAMLREELAQIVRDEAELLAETILSGLRERLGGRDVYLPPPSRPTPKSGVGE